MSSSPYADEGSIAHELAAMCLREGKDAAAYMGRVILCHDYEHAAMSASRAPQWMRCSGSYALEQLVRGKFRPRSFSQQVDLDMVTGVQTYLNNLRQYVANGAVLYVEEEVPIGHLTGEEGATGKSDGVVIADDGKELQVHDLKFGEGVRVSAAYNEQLLIYASGALEKFALFGDFERIRLVIHQPRIHEAPDEWDCTLDELREFEKRCNASARMSRLAASRVDEWRNEAATSYLNPGEKQCKFCDAKAGNSAKGIQPCPSLAKYVGDAAFGGFEDLTKPPTVKVSTVPLPADNRMLGIYGTRIPLIEMWCRAVMAQIESEILSGRPVEHHKAVAGRRGNRAWFDAVEVEQAMKKMRLKHDEMYEYKLISPTTAEKLLKTQPKRWNKLVKQITQADGKPTVVPVTDPRPALLLTPPADDFEVLIEEESLV